MHVYFSYFVSKLKKFKLFQMMQENFVSYWTAIYLINPVKFEIEAYNLGTKISCNVDKNYLPCATYE